MNLMNSLVLALTAAALAVSAAAGAEKAAGEVEAVVPEPPRRAVYLPAARDANAPAGLRVRQLFDYPIRDCFITLGPDGTYYLVGTTQGADKAVSMWHENAGVRMWKSDDLRSWEYVGLVFGLERDAAWARAWKKSPWVSPNGELRRAVWAPEVHFAKGNWYIPYCMNYGGTGLLRSTTGRPEGPYADVDPAGPLTDGIDASLFVDDDGSAHFLHDGYQIAPMRPDLSGLAGPSTEIDMPDKGWGEGIFLFKHAGKYVFVNSGNPNTDDKTKPDTYDSFASVADDLAGPWAPRYRAIPLDGHNNVFRDKAGAYWSTFFGSGPNMPFNERPGLVPVEVGDDGRISMRRAAPRPTWRVTTEPPAGDYAAAGFDDAAWDEAAGALGDPQIEAFGPITDVGTPWRAAELWARATFDVAAEDAGRPVELFVRHSGPVEITLNGRPAATLSESADDYQFVPSSANLRAGENVIAAHARHADGLHYFDVGVVAPSPK